MSSIHEQPILAPRSHHAPEPMAPIPILPQNPYGPRLQTQCPKDSYNPDPLRERHSCPLGHVCTVSCCDVCM